MRRRNNPCMIPQKLGSWFIPYAYDVSHLVLKSMNRDNLINVKELGQRIKQKREREKLSLRAVAKVTDVSPSTLSRIESDKPLLC